jgi:hypothetical protein
MLFVLWAATLRETGRVRLYDCRYGGVAKVVEIPVAVSG